MTTCTISNCSQDYDESDPEAVKHHTEPVYCSRTSKRCNRCDGSPGCYTCGDSFCKCHAH